MNKIRLQKIKSEYLDGITYEQAKHFIEAIVDNCMYLRLHVRSK